MDPPSSFTDTYDPKVVAGLYGRAAYNPSFWLGLTPHEKGLIEEAAKTPTAEEMKAAPAVKMMEAQALRLSGLPGPKLKIAMAFLLVKWLARWLRVGDLEAVKYCLERGAVLKDAPCFYYALEKSDPASEFGRFLRSGDEKLLAAMFYRAAKSNSDAAFIPSAMSEGLTEMQKETAARSS